jgi:putative inorganic carbon (HCO3(-)) transporter
LKKIAVFLDRWSWLWLALAAPLLLFPSPKRTPALLIVPALWLLAWIVHRKPLTRTPLNGTLLVLSLMVLVSTWATYDLTVSLPKISGMVLAMGVYFAAARAGKRITGWWWGMLLFLMMGGGVAALGMLGIDWAVGKIGFIDRILTRLPTYISGLPGAESGFHPNTVAATLLWVLPAFVVFAIALTTRRRAIRAAFGEGWATLLQIFSVGASLFVLGVFLLTQSRSSYIGLAGSGIVMLFIVLLSRWRWPTLGGLIILLFALALILSQVGVDPLINWLTTSGLASNSGFSLNSLEARLEIWSRALYGLQDFSFTGMGMNTFRTVVHVLYPLFTISPEKDIGHAHNEFLQAGLDLGLPGLIAFLGVYMGAFWMLIGIWGQRGRSNQGYFPLNIHKVAVLGLGGGLLAHLIFGLIDAVPLGARSGFLFWASLGLISGLYLQEREPV